MTKSDNTKKNVIFVTFVLQKLQKQLINVSMEDLLALNDEFSHLPNAQFYFVGLPIYGP